MERIDAATGDLHSSVNGEPLLSVAGLRTQFALGPVSVPAVDGVSFDLHRGETVGLVGESGSGKSATALSILRVLPRTGRVVAGSAMFDGSDLLTATERHMRSVRGRRISMIFQDPLTALNPMLSIGLQLAEGLQVHLDLSRAEARGRALELLDQVGISSPERVARSYPHELSGGMRQRVVIAIAVSCEPALILADEPTTALDVTIQAQILELLAGMADRLGIATLLITHDLAVVARYTDRTLVMYAGKIVETGATRSIFHAPGHPYTAALLKSTPRLDDQTRGRVTPIEGSPPDPLHLAPGCRFSPRCPYAEDICRESEPELEPVDGDGDRLAACWVKPQLEGTR